MTQANLSIAITFFSVVLEFALVDCPRAIRHHPKTVQLPVTELARVSVPRGRPLSESVSLYLTVYELSFIKAAVCHDEFAVAW